MRKASKRKHAKNAKNAKRATNPIDFLIFPALP
jgi:hypothetical protein